MRVPTVARVLGGRLALAAIALLAAGPAWGAKPVARILAVQGNVAIERSADSVRPAQVFGTVYEGERLVVADAGHVVLAFRASGRLERLKPGAKAVAGVDGCTPREAVEPPEVPQAQGPAVSGAVRELKPLTHAGVIIVRSGGDSPSLPPRVSPVVGATILSPRPLFNWPAVKDARAYELAVSSGGRTLWSERTEQTELRYGASAKLRSGFAYQWRVEAVSADGSSRPAWEGEFAVASDAQCERAAEMTALASGDDPAMIALAVAWLEENGLAAEALAACERLAGLKAEAAPVQGYLHELYFRAGRGEDADRAREAFQRLRPPPPKPPWLGLPKKG